MFLSTFHKIEGLIDSITLLRVYIYVRIYFIWIQNLTLITLKLTLPNVYEISQLVAQV
jgi:hypothetical protein